MEIATYILENSIDNEYSSSFLFTELNKDITLFFNQNKIQFMYSGNKYWYNTEQFYDVYSSFKIMNDLQNLF